MRDQEIRRHDRHDAEPAGCRPPEESRSDSEDHGRGPRGDGPRGDSRRGDGPRGVGRRRVRGDFPGQGRGGVWRPGPGSVYPGRRPAGDEALIQLEMALFPIVTAGTDAQRAQARKILTESRT